MSVVGLGHLSPSPCRIDADFHAPVLCCDGKQTHRQMGWCVERTSMQRQNRHHCRTAWWKHMEGVGRMGIRTNNIHSTFYIVVGAEGRRGIKKYLQLTRGKPAGARSYRTARGSRHQNVSGHAVLHVLNSRLIAVGVECKEKHTR